MRVYCLIFFLVLFSCTNNYDKKSFDGSPSHTTNKSYLVDLGKNEKLILKNQVLEYLKCTGGQNIDAVSKYVYKGSLRALIDQNPEIKNENQALTSFKTGLVQMAKEAKKLKLSFQYKIQEAKKSLNIKNNLIAEFRVITIASRNKLNLADTTQFLAISNDKGENWKFLNKAESREALSYEFSSFEIEEIFSNNINDNK
jgi:hypothetical protein